MTPRTRPLALAAAVGALAIPALASANGLLVTASSSSTNQLISSVPFGTSFTFGTPTVRSGSVATLRSLISRDGRYAFMFHSVTQVGTVASYQRDPGTGEIGAQVDSVTVRGYQSGRMALTPNGRHLFVLSNAGLDNEIDVVDITDGGDLDLDVANRVAPGNAPTDIIVSDDGRHAYVTKSSNERGLSQFDITQAGRLVAKTPATVGTGSNTTDGLVFSNGGSRLHAVYFTFAGPAIITYAVDGATGQLTPVGALPGPTGLGSSAATALMGDGTTVASFAQGGLYAWTVDQSGTLGARSDPLDLDIAGVFPQGIAAATGGGRLFVVGADTMGTGATEGGVWSVRASRGQLQGLARETAFPTTARYRGVTIGPAGAPVASLSAPAAETGVAVTLDASASASPDAAGGPITRYDWDFGDGTTLSDGGPTPAHTYSAGGSYTATVTVTNAAGCSLGDGVWAGRMYSCVGGPSARASATVSVAAPGPAAAPAPGQSSGAGQGSAPSAPLTPAARARAAFSTAVGKAKVARTKALAACAMRPAPSRAACRTAATRTYTRTVALATAVRTRDLALAACAAKTGAAKATCTTAAKARYARDRARASRR